MKTNLFAITLLLTTGLAFAHEGHSHAKDAKADSKPAAADGKHAKHDHSHSGEKKGDDHDHEKAPNGGRLIHSVTPHAEFLLTSDRKVEIRFLEEGKVIAPSGQVVTVISGDRTSPTRLSFEVEGDKLVSSAALPEGGELPVVLQIKASADAKTVTERFTLNLAQCPTCEHLEYACVCEH